jgi:hypothetical protein
MVEANSKAAKEQETENQINTEFEAKKSQGAGKATLQSLSIWLDNPPFKSKNMGLKVKRYK